MAAVEAGKPFDLEKPITMTAEQADVLVAAAKEKGLVRSEGKEYVMKDGDVVEFLFNV